MKTTLLTLAALALSASAFAQHGGHGHHGAAAPAAAGATPYAGLQNREIKALSPEDQQRLLQGHGMTLALPAELNGYPGPTHVLELAAPLQLSEAQRSATEALMQRHKAQAREIGARVVEAERRLDTAFAQRRIDAESLQRQTRDIAELQAALRAEHLRTHLEQTALLTSEQVARYAELRGYGSRR